MVGISVLYLQLLAAGIVSLSNSVCMNILMKSLKSKKTS